MIADPFRFVRRLAVLTAVVVILGGTVFLYRGSVVPGLLFCLAGLLLAIAVARPSLVEAVWPGARWHRAAIVRGMLVVAFAAFLGATMAAPRPSSPPGAGVQSATTTDPIEPEPVGAGFADGASPTSPSAATAPIETPTTPLTVRPAPSMVIAGEGTARSSGGGAPQPTSTPLPPVAPPPSPTPLPDWDALMAAIEEPWARADWPAAEAAILRALDAYPRDPSLLDKLFAVRISRGDQLAEAGQRAEAARVYDSAREARPDPLVDTRLARLTPTAVPRRSVSVAGACQPIVIAEGDWFAVQLAILNTGEVPLDGVRIKASGPWEQFSIASMEPVGTIRLEGSTGEPELVSRLPIQPGQTTYMQVIAYANWPGQYLFNFRPARLDNEWLLDQNNRVPLVGCGLAVTP